MLFLKSSVFSAVALALLSVVLLPMIVFADPADSANYGRTVAILDQKDFCLFLPRWYGGRIAPSERNAVAFCTKKLDVAPDSRILPVNFTQSAHFVRNTYKGYIQVTGRMNRTRYGLSRHDQGGQYDPKAPKGSKCAGYKYFVSLVEPADNIYCIRCCNRKYDCPVNKSTLGCRRVIRGNYW